jgi:Arc/MetJ-type ribon-helix-helix transcriptional regulator
VLNPFSHANEVIREGLRLLQEEVEWRAEIRHKVAEGIAQAKARKLIDGQNTIAAVLESLDDSARKSVQPDRTRPI